MRLGTKLVLMFCSMLAAAMPCHAATERVEAVIASITDNRLILQNDTMIELAGVRILEQQDFDRLSKQWIGSIIHYQPVYTNRFGAIEALVWQKDMLLQQQLIQQGVALVYARQPNLEIAHWMVWEDTTYTAPYQFAAEKAGVCIKQWCIINGRVRDVTVKGSQAFLNFGEDWKSDFTVYIDKEMLGKIGAEALASYRGKNITVRGFVDWYYGPRIVLHHQEMLSYAHGSDSD